MAFGMPPIKPTESYYAASLFSGRVLARLTAYSAYLILFLHYHTRRHAAPERASSFYASDIVGRDAAIADVYAPSLHCTYINAGGFVSMRSIRRSGRLVTLFMVILTVLAGSASAFAKA